LKFPEQEILIVDLEAGQPTVRLENVLRVLQALGATLNVSSSEHSQTQARPK
jgi:hypothetical protein